MRIQYPFAAQPSLSRDGLFIVALLLGSALRFLGHLFDRLVKLVLSD